MTILAHLKRTKLAVDRFDEYHCDWVADLRKNLSRLPYEGVVALSTIFDVVKQELDQQKDERDDGRYDRK